MFGPFPCCCNQSFQRVFMLQIDHLHIPYLFLELDGFYMSYFPYFFTCSHPEYAWNIYW
jgi:hypothetical protein